jgi:transposase
VVVPPADQPPPPAPPRPAARRTLRQVAWLLQAAADRQPGGDAFYQALATACPDLALAAELAQSFGRLLREHRPEALDSWLAQAESCGLRELRRFALSLRQDYAAVRAAVEEVWSQGPTEGHIQRLKLLKRQGYGQASFRLLRQRVLLRPVARTSS